MRAWVEGFRAGGFSGRPGRTLKESPSAAVGRELLWRVSEVGDGQSVETPARLLRHDALREDARMVLERIPGDASPAG